MATTGFGGSGTTNRTAYFYGVGHSCRSDFSGFPAGNTNSAGGSPVVVTSVSVAGLSAGSASLVNVSGSNYSIRCTATGSPMYVGRNSDNGTELIDESTGGTLSPRGGLSGTFNWYTVPAKITNLSVTASSTSSGQVSISFSAPNNGGSGITGYRVYRGSTNLGDVRSDSGLTPGTTYSYTVRALNAAGEAQNSNSDSVVAGGNPSAPGSLTAVRSTTAENAIKLDWNAPSTTGAGGINGYNVYRNGTLYATLTGTATAYTASSGLVSGTSYTWTVRARNDWSDRAGSTSASSNSVAITAEGAPGAPTGVTAVGSEVSPGQIAVSWSAPSYTGVGGITGYDVYQSTGTKLGSTSSSVSTFTATNLTPGLSYGFYVKAKNALTASAGVQGDQSGTAYATALGDPPAPTGVTLVPSTVIPGRLTLAWTYPAIGVVAVSGYTIYQGTSPSGVKIAVTKAMSYTIDGLTPGTPASFYLKARNTVTDPAGSDGGPDSITVTATPGSVATQTTVSSAGVIANTTNTVFSGPATVSATTANTFTYTRAGDAYASAPLATSVSPVVDSTNVALNGTYAMSTPTPTSLSYARTTPNVKKISSGGYLADTTNQALNGTYTLTAADAFTHTFSYAKTTANVAEVSTAGTASNATNAVFNGTGFTIIAETLNTFSYAKTAANVTEISASGTATDTTNRDYYNGTFTVKDLPAYNQFTYQRGA